MSEAILFSPHHDDAELFSAYACLRYKPLVVVCFGDATVQADRGITAAMRREETSAAMDVLGCEWDELPITDHTDPASLVDAEQVLEACMEELRDSGRWSHVIAPAWEHNGHEGHNMVANTVTRVWRDVQVTRYTTYTRGGGRTITDREVAPEPGWRATKLKALACYSSQIEERSTRSWFCHPDMLREFVA
jgi:LmbE family N-acetylglucosaminyl deacetylase